jgi:Lipoxygenase
VRALCQSTNLRPATDIFSRSGANIGDLDDWYTDARFAQQYLTGTNPTTIQLLSPAFLVEFREAATDQGRKDISDILVNANKSSLYMTDCSYFRDALQVGTHDPIVLKTDDKDEPTRYGCASVTLFQLHDDGKLHPLGIVIDYKGTMKESVTLFNKRISPSDPTRGEFWPWRYAKTCAQSSDWTLHEITVHLVNTHLIEEAIIVATHRNIPVDNIIYQILEPHWFRTLSLNAAARETLVPKVVLALTGYSEDQGHKFINHAYSNFNFKERYVPKDLKTRGFDPAELSAPRFRNSVYAQNINLMWNAIRTFVNSMVRLKYKTPADVTGDDHITKWYQEIQSDKGAKIPSFPKITTVEELVDAITMCIHIASPQHSAVNYLQSFYQTFVINKPPCLFQPLPGNLDSLKLVTEGFLVKSLPIGHQRQWLLAAHIPWLLSFRPAEDNNLINYAASLYNVYKKKGPEERGAEITAIAKAFYDGLVRLIDKFEEQSQGMGEKEMMIKYKVLDPREAAVSILI